MKYLDIYAYKLSKLNCSVNTTLKIREQFQSCINTNTWGKGRTRQLRVNNKFYMGRKKLKF